MTAIHVERAGISANGDEMIRALVVSSETPSTLPINGSSVIGMANDQVFAPMSVLYVTGEAETKLYIANENGVFVPQ